MKPSLAAFPKAYMQALCRDGSMKIRDWVELAGQLAIDGLEWYAGFLEMKDRQNWAQCRKVAEDQGLSIPMLCCSPDFTHPDKSFREEQIARQQHWIDMAQILGARYCRVLSGQRRPELPRDSGIGFAAQCILACLPYAQERGITLIIENHYKDDFWIYPEFVQKMDDFCLLLDQIDHPAFGVNFDPSNAFLAGEDPQELLHRIAHRVVTMHASDRYLKTGTLDDLRREESGSEGYARRLAHGEIGKGLNDYDALFSKLRSVGFKGWISIEDGVEGFDQLQRSVAFLRRKIDQHFA